MLGLLRDLLDISKIESGKLELRILENDYLAIVKKNIKLNTVLATKKSIRISLVHDETIPPINCDKEKVIQVLDNLISNAVKYSQPETEITVTVSLSDNNIVTKIIDQGQGIPASELDVVFKPFEKTSVRTTSGEKSTGMGLAIVKKIIEGHNGEVGVSSIEGKGSTFYFSLPLT